MPVYTHFDIDYAALRLGQRIRDERKKRGWTLKDLASRLSISVGTLSAIENQKAPLGVDLFTAISQALGLPVDALLPPNGAGHFHVGRHRTVDAQPALPVKIVNPARESVMSYHNRLWPLADAFVGKYMEPLEIEILPVREHDLHFISHNHEEFFFVLRGELECLVKTPDGLVKEVLGPGDCMYFWSYLPHCIRSISEHPVRCVHLLYSLHEAADSEYATSKSGPVIYLTDASHKNVAQHVASKILSLRQARGMSITDFAGEIGISVRRLARIERGITPISLELLLHICRTFRKPRGYFLAGTSTDRPFHYVHRANQVRRGAKSAEQAAQPAACCRAAECHPLADGFPNRGIQPYLMRLDSPDHDERSAPPVAHAGQEFVYVLSGAVRLLTRHDCEQVTETLFPGDSCFIDASAPHRFVEARFNPYDRSPAEMIAVFWRPPQAHTLPGPS